MQIIKLLLFISIGWFQFADVVAQSNPKALAKSSVVSESPTAIGQQVRWRGVSNNDKTFDIANLKGTVVLFYYWSTNCAVCLENMSELRENVKGWKGKPFLLLTINVDIKRGDYDNYAKLSRITQGDNAQIVLTYHKDVRDDGLAKSAQLPSSYVVDAKGILRYSHSGRIPAQYWDDIADLMP